MQRADAVEIRISNGMYLVTGEIVKGDAAKFDRFAKTAPTGTTTVSLNSPGGLLSEGIELGRIFRTKSLGTRVDGTRVCASACVFAFAGGLVREVQPGAKIGVHMASISSSAEYISALRKLLVDPTINVDDRIRLIVLLNEQATARSSARQATYLSEMSISLRLLTPTTNTSHLEVYWLSRAELTEFNLVNVD